MSNMSDWKKIQLIAELQKQLAELQFVLIIKGQTTIFTDPYDFKDVFRQHIRWIRRAMDDLERVLGELTQ